MREGIPYPVIASPSVDIRGLVPSSTAAGKHGCHVSVWHCGRSLSLVSTLSRSHKSHLEGGRPLRRDTHPWGKWPLGLNHRVTEGSYAAMSICLFPQAPLPYPQGPASPFSHHSVSVHPSHSGWLHVCSFGRGEYQQVVENTDLGCCRGS